jgi:hypothetical protein
LTQDVNDEKDLCPVVGVVSNPIRVNVHTVNTQCKLNGFLGVSDLNLTSLES